MSNTEMHITGSESTEQLFEKAIAENSRRLLAVAQGIVGNRVVAEDVLQQAFLNLYKHRQRYDWHEAGGLLRRSVVNEALRYLRQPRMTVVAEDYAGKPNSPLGEMIVNEKVAMVRKAIERLPDHFRAALVLCEYEQLPYEEIARTLGASLPQVKTWIFRARRQLAQMLKSYADGSEPVVE